MLNAKTFANAAATVMAVWVVVCAALSYIAPDIVFNLARSWMHTINLESIKTTYSPDFGLLIYGLVIATVLTWITTYATIALYNRWVK